MQADGVGEVEQILFERKPGRSPGWAKHAWSSVFAPWNAGATILIYDYQRFDARRVLETIVKTAFADLAKQYPGYDNSG